jgi:hypothetical protein
MMSGIRGHDLRVACSTFTVISEHRLQSRHFVENQAMPNTIVLGHLISRGLPGCFVDSLDDRRLDLPVEAAFFLGATCTAMTSYGVLVLRLSVDLVSFCYIF